MESGPSENGIRITVLLPGSSAAGGGASTTLSACPLRPHPAETAGNATARLDMLVIRTSSSRPALMPNSDRHDQPPVTLAVTFTGTDPAAATGRVFAPTTVTGMEVESKPVRLCASTTHGHGRGGI